MRTPCIEEAGRRLIGIGVPLGMSLAAPAFAATFVISPDWPNYLLVASLAALALGLTVKGLEGRRTGALGRDRFSARFDRHLSQQRAEAVTTATSACGGADGDARQQQRLEDVQPRPRVPRSGTVPDLPAQ